jgi:hypothetical protein
VHKVQFLHCIFPNIWLAVTEKFKLLIRKAQGGLTQLAEKLSERLELEESQEKVRLLGETMTLQEER